jgi:hypothetical protein
MAASRCDQTFVCTGPHTSALTCKLLPKRVGPTKQITHQRVLKGHVKLYAVRMLLRLVSLVTDALSHRIQIG